MKMSVLMTMLKLAMTAVSFGGLCTALRRATGLDDMSAPLTTAGLVIAVLMLGGTAGLLSAAWWALYTAGFIALAWVLISERRAPDWRAPLLCLLALLYGIWLLGRAYYSENDTVSHWGLAVKYLLRLNAFPDSSTRLIYYQSYPLGAAAYIYYLCRAVSHTEGAALVAQFMLCVFSLMPVISLVRANRPLGWAIVLAASAFLLSYNTALTCLRVDGLLGFMGIGGTAIACRWFDEPRKALRGALPVAVALVFIKSSGAFFSACIALVLILSAWRRAGRRAGLHTLLGCAVAVAAAMALWELHMKLAFPAGASSRHAVSVENYSVMLSEKPAAMIRWIVVAMLKRLLHPGRVELVLLALGAALYLGLRLAIRSRDRDRAVWLPRLRGTALACVAIFALWYVMMIGLYVFSMPADEARQLISVQRYERTVITYVAGLVLMLTVAYLCREEFSPGARGGAAGLCGVAAAMAVLVFATPQGGVMAQRLLHPGAAKPAEFAGLLTLRENREIAEEKRYLVFARHDVRPLNLSLYMTKYELFSNDIMLIVGGIDQEGYDSSGYYTFSNTYMHNSDIAEADDLRAVLAENMDRFDYLLVLDRDPEFENALSEFLERYSGDTPVLYAY